LHASHAAVQAEPQHTASAQKPLAHCAVRPHDCPAASFGTHEVPSQNAPAAQAASRVQPVGQPAVVPSHRYGAHEGAPALEAAAGAQVPVAPHVSQAPAQAVEQQTPSAQKPLAHWFGAAQAAAMDFFGTHAAPSQYEVATHCESSAHEPGQSAAPPQTYGAHAGAPAPPSGTGWQVPRLPAWSHRSHPPSQVLSQQTPSSQWRLAHSPALRQPKPSAR
jgi:hypothetical protein